MNKQYFSLWRELIALSWRRQRGLTIAAFCAILGSVVAVAISALAIRAAVDNTVHQQTTTAVVAAIIAAAAYALTAVLQRVMNILVNTTLDRVGRLELHGQIHHDIATIEGIDHLERTDYLDRITLVRTASGSIMAWTWFSLLAVASAMQLAIMLILLGTVTPWLLLLLVFAVIPILCDNRGQKAVRATEVATAEMYRLQQELFDLAVQATSGKDIRVACAGPEIANRQVQAWDTATQQRYQAQVKAAGWKFAGWAVFAVSFVGALAFITYRTSTGVGTIGDLVLTVMVASSLRQSLQSAVASTIQTTGAGKLVEPYLWLREYTAAEAKRSAGTQAPPSHLAEGIVLDNVCFTYPGTDRQVLQDVSITIPQGTVVAVVGEYGSGKTTLVKLLAKCYQPSAGRILIDGVDLAELNTAQWRANISAAFQDFARFHTKVREAIGLGDLTRLSDDDAIMSAVRDADAEQIVAKLPHGLDTQLGRALGGVELSEGQWQRTALARAAMRANPVLLVLDEPTASLDAPSEQAIYQHHMSRARTLAQHTGAVTVIVSHRFSTVAGADLILVLDNGQLVESGSHDELLAIGGRYADLYGIQANAYADIA